MKKLLIVIMLILAMNTYTFAKDNSFPKENKEQINTKDAPKPIGSYSQGIKANDFLFISGQIPIDPKTGELYNGKFIDQVELTLRNLSAVIKAAGGSLNNIVKLTIFLPDLNNFSAVNEAVAKFFASPYPARSVIGVKALPKNASVEIEAIAKI